MKVDLPDRTTGSRPIALKVRPDLQITESLYQGEASWIVKDPVRMKYFRLREPEYEVFQLLRGVLTARQIKEALQVKFPQDKIEIREVLNLVNSFHKNGLLVSDASGQAEPLRRRHHKEVRQKALQLLSSAIALRLPGVDPEPFLDRAYPLVRWFFSRTMLLVNLALMLGALSLVLLNLPEVARRMPEFQQFFGLNNLLFMGCLLIVTKSVHELGHGLMCKHFGGECHEIGFMFLAFMPAMYCNTSDSWIMPNKWHRIAIGAAGMYVEVVMAAICTFGWWYSQPGTFHYLCLNIMFLSGVSTILFNANPLLRYDGYYMLSDYLEIPNLSQKSKLSIISRLRSWCLGMDPIPSRMLPSRNRTIFALYSVASFLYRWFVILMIAWFISEVLKPYKLEVLANLVIAMAFVGMVVVPLFRLVKFFSYPGRFRNVNRRRFLLSSALFAVGCVAFLFVPLPHSVFVSFVVEPDQAQQVFVNQAGTIKTLLVQPGDRVEPGDTLAILENDDLELSLAQARGELAKVTSQLEDMQLQKSVDVEIAQRFRVAQTEKAKLEKQLLIWEKQESELTLVANRAGVVIPARRRMDPSVEQSKGWAGSLFDLENQAIYLQRGEAFCTIGDPREMKATLIVDESDVKLIEAGQSVELILNQYPGQEMVSQLDGVSRDELETLPPELSKSFGGPIAGLPNADGTESPLLNCYTAVAKLNGEEKSLLPGMSGVAKVRVGQSSLGRRLWRTFQSVIHFR